MSDTPFPNGTIVLVTDRTRDFFGKECTVDGSYTNEGLRYYTLCDESGWCAGAFLPRHFEVVTEAPRRERICSIPRCSELANESGHCARHDDVMTETPAHLVPVRSDRGFARLPAIPSTYGGDVRVYESSSAEHHRIWLAAKAPSDMNLWARYGDDTAYEAAGGQWVDAHAHLDVEEAVKLAEQIFSLAGFEVMDR